MADLLTGDPYKYAHNNREKKREKSRELVL